MAVEYEDFQEPRKVNVKGRGEMRFHAWVSESLMCFIGSENQRTYTLEISGGHVDRREDGTLEFAEPYDVEFSKEGWSLSRQLEDVGVQLR